MAEAWNRKEVFFKALGLPEAEREAYLQTACPDELARAEIRQLIQHHGEMGSAFLIDPAKTLTVPPNAPRMIAEFRVLGLLGEGGMGVVYLAEDTILGRQVALKVLARHLTGSEQALARFRDEARSAAGLKHPGIVPVFKFGQDGDTHYIASEYVDGPTLAFIIADRKNTTKTSTQGDRDWHRRAASIIAGLADALDCAHKANIVHRDVKPSNILMDRQLGPRLTDFGVAKHLVEDDRKEHTRLIGSCHYMSPEQASIAGSRVDQRSDVFSLGVVLYELLTLRRAFDGPDASNVLRAVLESDPPRLRVIDPRIPRDLETICHKAMEKDPAHRFQTAAHIAADMRCFLSGAPILAQPPSLGRRARYWISKRQRFLLVAACVFLTLTGLGLYYLLQAAHNERLAWFSVESDVPGSKAYLQRISAETYEVNKEWEYLGETPLSTQLVPPGHYRITVQHPASGTIVEFNAPLYNAGRDEHIRYHAHSKGTPFQFNATETKSRHGFFPVLTDDPNKDMVLVEAGSYIVGWHETDKNPQIHKRPVTLTAFYIDKYEVSNAEYKQFIDSTGFSQPILWRTLGYDAQYAEHPVLGIPVEEAEAYARWRGKRLPTVWEWQAAMRSKEGWDYPWGNDWNARPQIAEPTLDDYKIWRKWDDFLTFDLNRRRTVPTRSNDPCISKLGIVHGFGNAREITGSSTDPAGVFVQGRSWFDPPDQTLGQGYSYQLHGSDSFLGFRCARSANSSREN